MRIAFVTNQLSAGGAEIQMAMLARHVRTAGHKVCVVSLLPGGKFTSELEADGIPVCAIDLRARPQSVARLIAFCRRQQPQLAHAHLFHSNIAARLLRLICPFAVVVSTIHSLAESGRESREVKARDLVYRITDPLSDATVCVSQSVADRHLHAHAVRSRKLRVIPNGVDTQRFRPDAELRRATRAALGAGDEFVWVAAGRLMWKKNYPLMLHAMAKCGTGVLLVAGTGPDDSALRASATHLGANARFLGSVADIPALMNAADAYLLSSDVEGLPMALLEAAASGLPAVATDVGGVPEIIADGVSGQITAAGDVSAFADAMLRIVSAPPEERARMGVAARQHVREKFEIHGVVRQWIELYEELLGR